MSARDDVYEEALGTGELSMLPTYSSQMFFDDCGASELVSMKYQANIGQADPDASTGLKHPQSSQMFFAVIAVARRQAFGHNDTHVVPMSQDMRRYAEFLRNLPDLHPLMLSR